MIVTTPETVLLLAGEVIVMPAPAAAGFTVSAASTKTIALIVRAGICHCARPAITQNSPAASPSAHAGTNGQRAQRTVILPFGTERNESVRFATNVLGEVGTQGTWWISIDSFVNNSEKRESVSLLTPNRID
jgi:hypothetical protein